MTLHRYVMLVYTSRHNVVKLYTAVIYKFSQLACVSHFQSSLLFAGKARSLP
jgi:hypothetical protein